MVDRGEATPTGTVDQYLSFTVAGTAYGIPILKVKEILQYEPPTRVPGTPASIRGVVNVRGAVVPVVDLGVKFGKAEAAPTKLTCVLIVEGRAGAEHYVLGVVAGAVNEVVGLRPEEVEQPPTFGTETKLDYLVGMGKVGKGFVLLIDIDRVLASPEKDLASQMASSRSAGLDAPVLLDEPASTAPMPQETAGRC